MNSVVRHQVMEVVVREQDSSLTRVKPVLDALLERDPSGIGWLPNLLNLPEFPGVSALETLTDLEDFGWGHSEKSLLPPRVLLQWIVCCGAPQSATASASQTTQEKRAALFRHDPEVIGEALALLSRLNLPSKAWYILEGPSRPDVYLQTAEAIVVIEGKRTEPEATTKTSWMPGRLQMLRHLDCAWEIRGSRRVFGFFIVEGDGKAEAVGVPTRWTDVVTETVSPASLRASLPHRTAEEREEIARCFLGATTWQRVCAELGVDWTNLPDRLTKDN